MAIAALSTIQSSRIGASLFYKKEKRTVGSIEMDLLLSETTVMESEVAEHPIENGSNIATHIRNKLRSGSLVGLVSNWSLSAANALNTEGSVKNRALETLDLLTKLWEARQPVVITTSLWQYMKAVITNITAKRDGDSGDAQTFEISFKEVKIVEIKEVALEAQTEVGQIDSEEKKQASKEKKKGSSSPKSAKTTKGTGLGQPGKPDMMIEPLR